jgi:multiple sugar transport system ATP-binding protein
MVYVTHDQLEAMTMSERIAVMRDGKLQQFASPQDIYERPVNDFVAGFIGTPAMNLIAGRLSGTAGDRVFESGTWALPIGELALMDESASGDAERRVRIGIRPEDIMLDDTGDAARVAVVEPTGHEVIVVFDYHGNEIVARMGADVRLRPDDVVKLKLRVDRLHLFAVSDGGRLNDDVARGGA